MAERNRQPVNTRDPGLPGVVSLSGVTRSYHEGADRRVILDQLDFRADGGEFIAIGGPSGSGKSTLLNLMAGLDVPDRGIVGVAGENVAALEGNRRTLHRRRHIGLVFQFFNLVPTLSVTENLLLPLVLNGMPADTPAIDRLLDEFDLLRCRDDYPETLSGGEQQRVAVLRAAVHEPAVILADEPTGNLDRERGEQVIHHLRRVAQRGTCVIMVTHSRQAARATDRQLHLVDGQLAPWDW